MNLHQLIFELRQRNVLKVASVYAVSAAGAVQLLTATAPFLGIPDYLVTLFIILSIIGLPITIFLSWKYEIIEEKDMVRNHPSPDHGSGKSIATINLRTILILILAAVAITALIYSSTLRQLKSNPL